MADVDFYPIHPWAGTESPWTSSNKALGRFIEHHRSDLKAGHSAAQTIRSHLASLFNVMDELCRNCCPWCPDPCCIVNKVWFDFRDLLFLHLLKLPIPPAQLNCGHHQACRYLAHRGCRIPRIIRPWACTRYLCATQRRFLDRLDGAVTSELQRTTDTIHDLRFEMEISVCRICSSWRPP
ncbi:hypothetical protein D3OALGA1CA_3618 [Olavius algarvensis associated proteobacterium Delta 3]|nr:hypothetical protein D3OALGA1CA_3618 [Olavius algarvensis associated proteobacterium Delta 3]CAB5147243.1 hypothetical protein D3OALGB2SA_4580 [Olavius algarvensis associated proteobacterium Delta 3]